MSVNVSGGDGSETITDKFLDFFKNYYRDEIGVLAQRYPQETRSLKIKFDDLYRYDRDMAEDWLKKPDQMREYAEEALRLYDLPADIELASAHVRLVELPSYQEFAIGQIDPDDHLGKLIGLKGQVIEQTDVKPLVTEAAFECQRCGTMTYIPQSTNKMQEPHECQGCERDGPFELNIGQSELENYQRVRLQKPPEEAEDGQSEFDVNVRDDLVRSASSGNRVTINGVLNGKQETKNGEKMPTLNLYSDALSVEKDETDWSDADIEEHLDRIREIADRDDVYDIITKSIKVTHKGHDMIKLAIAMQLFQGVAKSLPDGSEIRGTIHVLLVGDPGVDKSGILNYAKRVTPGAIYTDGSGSTKAGLTASAVQSDLDGGGWTIRGGSLVKAHGSLAAIDELDDMEEEDRGGMKESMASGTISVSKADKNVTLPAQTSVLAAANPKFGRYDPYQPIGEQIDLHPALMSRFDLIFPMQDQVDEESDRELAEHLGQMVQVGQKQAAGEDLGEKERATATPEVSQEVLRAYIAYARENINPVITDEAKEYISENYVEVRTSTDEEDSPVPTTARSVLALHRLAEASARMRLSDRVTIEDAERVIEVWLDCMKRIGIDPETGEFDADVLETGNSKSQRDRIKRIMSILSQYTDDPDYQYGAPMSEALEDADALDIDEETFKQQIETLENKKEVFTMQKKDETYIGMI